MKSITQRTEIAPDRGAQFSDCRTWRYALWRHWGRQGFADVVAFVGLNPSTADERQDDPTVRRCINFARSWGKVGMYMLNAYAFRATDPRDMKAAADPLGPGNLEALSYYGGRSGLVIAAWGVHCDPDHEHVVCRAIGRPIYCLGRTKDGRPRHPLYLRADTQAELFWKP